MSLKSHNHLMMKVILNQLVLRSNHLTVKKLFCFIYKSNIWLRHDRQNFDLSHKLKAIKVITYWRRVEE